jgi:hypothetical protein
MAVLWAAHNERKVSEPRGNRSHSWIVLISDFVQKIICTKSEIGQPSPLDSYITSDPFALGSLIALMMEALRTSETSVNLNATTWLHTSRRENLKYYRFEEVVLDLVTAALEDKFLRHKNCFQYVHRMEVYGFPKQINNYEHDFEINFEVLMAIKTSVFVLWVVTPLGLVDKSQRFGGTYCLHLQG